MSREAASILETLATVVVLLAPHLPLQTRMPALARPVGRRRSLLHSHRWDSNRWRR